MHRPRRGSLNPDNVLGSLTNENSTSEATTIARAVLNRSDVMGELLRLMAWLEPEQLDECEQALHRARENRSLMLHQCADATFGRETVAGGDKGDPKRLNIAEGNAMASPRVARQMKKSLEGTQNK